MAHDGVRAVNGPLSKKHRARSLNNFRSADLARDSSSPAGSSVLRFTGSSSQHARGSSENRLHCPEIPSIPSEGLHDMQTRSRSQRGSGLTPPLSGPRDATEFLFHPIPSNTKEKYHDISTSFQKSSYVVCAAQSKRLHTRAQYKTERKSTKQFSLKSSGLLLSLLDRVSQQSPYMEEMNMVWGNVNLFTKKLLHDCHVFVKTPRVVSLSLMINS